MGHPENGQLQALLDGELNGPDVRQIRAHLAECPDCRSEVDFLEAASLRTQEALTLLDVPPRASEALAHLEATRARSKDPRILSRITLPWAASIALLLTAVAVSAMPGSPVRSWLVKEWQGSRSSVSPPAEVPSGGEADPRQTGTAWTGSETGAGVRLEAGRLEIRIQGLGKEAGLRVQWVEGEEAWVYAGEGTRFSSVVGRLEAHDPPGNIRVVIPTDSREVSLVVNGHLLLRKSGAELEVLGPVEERTPSEILFGPSRGGNGSEGGTAPGTPNATGVPNATGARNPSAPPAPSGPPNGLGALGVEKS